MKKEILTISIILTFSISFISVTYISAQNQPGFEKKMYIDSLNRLYTQTSLPLYLYISNKPNDSNPVPLSKNYSNTKNNNVEPIYLDGNGKHHIKHYDEIEKVPEVFVIFADGKAPKTTHIFEKATPYLKNHKKIFGKNQRIILKATDDMSGVEKSFYSINGEEFKEYKSPFNIQTSGNYNLKYYSVDNVGNVETVKQESFSIDDIAPSTTYTITGELENNIITTKSIIYLQAADTSTGISKILYHIDNKPDKVSVSGKISLKNIEEGQHTIYYHSVDNAGNAESEKSFDFFLDKTPPIVATDILGDKYIVGKKIFFSGRTKLKLTAVDNKAGVKEVKYSINGSEFKDYKDPFYLPSKKGMHIIDYYAIDNLGNRTGSVVNGKYLEYQHFVSSVYVDLTGPSLSHKIIGKQLLTRDTLFINDKTKVELLQTDPESGAQKITYTVNQSPEEIEYKEPLTFSDEGFHEINQIGYDNVNNRNFKTLCFVVDKQGPEIFYKYSVNSISKNDSIETYPYFVSIFLAPQDNLSGIESIKYSINNGALKFYTSSIKGFVKGKQNDVKIIVSDNLGNVSEKDLIFFVEK